MTIEMHSELGIIQSFPTLARALNWKHDNAKVLHNRTWLVDTTQPASVTVNVKDPTGRAKTVCVRGGLVP